MASACSNRRTRQYVSLGRVLCVGLVLAFGPVACGGDEDGGAERPGVGGALGANARVVTLARAELARRPPGRAGWVADELRLGPGDAVRHRHEPAFVYARRGAALQERPGDTVRLEEGRGAFVPEGVVHRHLARDGAAELWEIRLAAPGAAPSRGARRLFESEPLRGIPDRPVASFLAVTVPARGGMTTIHTHPGPEFIYQLNGRIEYQNDLIGTKRLGPGGAEGVPPDTAVQKRNPFAADALFLSWFLVDPDEPFAPRAEF